jgi:hypothetical protein
VCALAIAGWVRSKVVGDVVMWNGVDNCASLYLMDGVVRLLHAETGSYPPGWFYESFDWPTRGRTAGLRGWEDVREPWYGPLGFGYERDTTVGFSGRGDGYDRWGATVRTLHVPFWAIVLVNAVLPLLTIRRSHRRQRKMTGLCVECGYDLRATPERCPECGWSPLRAQAVV